MTIRVPRAMASAAVAAIGVDQLPVRASRRAGVAVAPPPVGGRTVVAGGVTVTGGRTVGGGRRSQLSSPEAVLWLSAKEQPDAT
ncbi:MAG TPA: hypothetical protein VF045_03760, partial [Acidimicrobiales bacterium]